MSRLVFFLLQVFFGFFPIKSKKIIFLSYYGSQYGCNPKYLSEYFVNNEPEWDVVWGFAHPQDYSVNGIRSVRYLSFRFFYELCTSRVFVTNYRMPLFFNKRKGQLYVQTWHSSLRLKMSEKDTERTLSHHYIKMAKKDSKQTDILLSGSQFNTTIFNRAFWNNGFIAQTGTPRNDLFFRNDVKLIDSIKHRIGVSNDSRIILYAPTFRKNRSMDYYNLDYLRLIQTAEEIYGGHWIVLLRLHPHLRNCYNYLSRGELVVDVTTYDDIQELLYISDIVISDYSSLIFDFALTKRPCLLFVQDLEEYTTQDRELYFDISSLPFPLSRSNAELFQQLREWNQAQYEESVTAFLDRIGSYEDGCAAKNVANVIKAQTSS